MDENNNSELICHVTGETTYKLKLTHISLTEDVVNSHESDWNFVFHLSCGFLHDLNCMVLSQLSRN